MALSPLSATSRRIVEQGASGLIGARKPFDKNVGWRTTGPIQSPGEKIIGRLVGVGGSMSDDLHGAFVSWATEWDVYVGERDWQNLTVAQQDAVIIHETWTFGGREMADPHQFIMDIRLKKLQAMGIRSAVICARAAAEEAGRLPKDMHLGNWSPRDRKEVLRFLDGTRLAKRFKEAWRTLDGSNAQKRTPIQGDDLVRIAQTNRAPSPLDQCIGLSYRGAQQIARKLVP